MDFLSRPGGFFHRCKVRSGKVGYEGKGTLIKVAYVLRTVA